MPQAVVAGAIAAGAGDYEATAADQTRDVPPPNNSLADDVWLGITMGYGGSVNVVSPAGWTNILDNQNGQSMVPNISWIRYTGSLPNLTWDVGTGNSRLFSAVILPIRGAHVTAPIQAQSATGSFTASSGDTTANPPSVDVGTNGLVIICGYHSSGANPWTAPAGYTIRSRTDVNRLLVVASSTDDALLSGTQDPGNLSGPVSGGDNNCWDGVTISIAASGVATVSYRRRTLATFGVGA